MDIKNALAINSNGEIIETFSENADAEEYILNQ